MKQMKTLQILNYLNLKSNCTSYINDAGEKEVEMAVPLKHLSTSEK